MNKDHCLCTDKYFLIDSLVKTGFARVIIEMEILSRAIVQKLKVYSISIVLYDQNVWFAVFGVLVKCFVQIMF